MLVAVNATGAGKGHRTVLAIAQALAGQLDVAVLIARFVTSSRSSRGVTG